MHVLCFSKHKSSMSAFSFDVPQELLRQWLINCQMEAGSSWCRVHITLLSYWSTSHYVWCQEDFILPGGLLFFMYFSTRHWQHCCVMTFIFANISHTQVKEKHLYHLCCKHFYFVIYLNVLCCNSIIAHFVIKTSHEFISFFIIRALFSSPYLYELLIRFTFQWIFH